MSLDIENARVIYKNFSGAKNDFNRNGTRTVDIVIEDPEVAQMLADDGWNVKQTRVREEGDEPQFYINAVINFNPPYGEPPKITMRMVDKNGKLVSRTNLTENTVSALDKLKILDIDVRLNPHEWEMNGRSGIKGYVEVLVANVLQDPFLSKYADEEFPMDDEPEELPFN